jgi:hypothetical protein
MKTNRKIIPLLVFLLIIALFGTGLTLYGGNIIDYAWKRWKKEKTLPMADISGRLKNSSAYLVACGGVKVILNKKQLTKGYNLSELINGVRIPVNLYLGQKGILIDAKVYGKKEHDVIAVIKKNKWKDLPPEYDLNFSVNAFEIIGANGKPLLQVQIKSGNEVHVGGCFYQGRNKISITPERINFYVNECEGEKIFKYPSSKYLGQLETREKVDSEEKRFHLLGPKELVKSANELLAKLSNLFCVNLKGSSKNKKLEDPLAIENHSVDTYKKIYRNDALQIRNEFFNRMKNMNRAQQAVNEFIFREPAGFFGLAEIDFSLRYLKNRYVFNYSELGNDKLKNRAANYVQALELLLKAHKINEVDLCRYDKELKVEGIILLEEINRRLPERRKFDKDVEFLMLTKWTINPFQILEMKKKVKLFADRLSPNPDKLSRSQRSGLRLGERSRSRGCSEA